jgi:gliding motility-associated-like protein
MSRFFQQVSFLILITILLMWHNSSAQLIGADVFIKGDYVEIGVGTGGWYGTGANAPAGYHPRSPGPTLGFVSDPDKDGFTVGIPNFCGDYFVPGFPQEGWDIQVGNLWAKAWLSSGLTGGITGSNVSYTASATDFKTVWEGAYAGLAIRQTTILKKNKLYFLIKVTFKNTTTADINDIYYDRTLDPDNASTMGSLTGVVTSPGATTVNTIEYKLPNPQSKSLVSAVATLTVQKDIGGGMLDTVDYPVYLGIGSKDCRANPYILSSGLTPSTLDSPSRLYKNDPTLTHLFDSGETNTLDAATGLIFNIPKIKPGDSTSFFMAYVLSTADLDSAFADLSPVFSYDGKEYQSGDTVKLCREATAADERKNLDIVGGEDYSWTWSPRAGLENLTGTDNSILLTNTPVTYVAKPSETFGCQDSMVLTIMPYINPSPPTVVSPITYCKNDPSSPLIATGMAGAKINYYTSATSTTALSTFTPSTINAGIFTFYASQQNGICESSRTPITVIVNPLPKLDSLTYTNPTYCAATDGTITFRTDSANKDYTLTYDKDGVPVTLSFTSNALRKYTITGLGGGSYAAFVITNKFGCKSKPVYGPLLLVDPVPPGPPLTNNGPLCVGDTVRLTAAFVDATATYRWTGPDGFSSSSQNPVFVSTPNSGGEYSLIATVGPCNYKPSKTTLVITPTPKHQVFISPLSICEGSDLNVDILREALSITYLWSGNGVSLINQGLTIPNVQQGSSGAYVLTAESDNGCITKDTINVLVDQRVRFTPPNDTAICSVDSASLVVLSNVSTVLWSPTKGLSDSVGRAVKARPDSTVTYGLVAKSGNSCPDTSGKTTVTVIAAPKVLGYDTVVRMNVPYTVLPVFGQGVVRYKWTPSDSLSCDNCPNPVFNSNRMMVYKVEGINKEGCIGTALIKIDVFCDGANVTMPNAFTPNGDGNNDVFYVRGTGFTVKSFSIYNRNGQVVFNKENFIPNDPKYGWDGTFGGQPVSDVAGFVYMMEIVCANSKNAPELIKGTLLMIK